MNSYQAGQKLLCGEYTSYTPSGSDNFKKVNRWYTTPQYGDVVYFYSESLKRIAHVGIVIGVNSEKKTFKTVEGNTSSTEYSRNGGTVASHEYSYAVVGGKNRVQGFGRPVWASDTCSAQAFVETGLAEIGYEEKASNKNLDDFHANVGNANYTKYGKWYGMNPAQWCQMFVSWCAYQACAQQEQRKSGWTDLNGFWYYFESGYAVRDQWRYINGRWYVFDGEGKMITGWFKDSTGDWYYLADDGGMLSSQWLLYKGKQYYLTSSGVMARDAYIRSEMMISPMVYMHYYVGADGSWDASQDTETVPRGAQIAK